MKKVYLLVVLFLCGLSAKNLFASASAAASAVDDLGRELIEAARRGNKAEVEKLIAAGVNVDARRAENGNTPLMLVALYGHEDIMEQLLKAGANVNASGPRGYTALMRAAFWGHKNIVERLLLNDADKTIKSNDNETAEDIARSHGYDDLANIIRDYVPSGRSIKAARSYYGL